MRTRYRFAAIAATLLAAASASAQTRAPGANPISRGEQGIFAPAFRGGLDGPLGGPLGGPSEGNAMARSTPVHDAPVTPVPEPSEWLMLVAGLGAGLLVLRRGARRP